MTEYGYVRQELKDIPCTVNQKYDVTYHTTKLATADDECDINVDINVVYNPKTQTFSVDSDLCGSTELSNVAQVIDYVENLHG